MDKKILKIIINAFILIIVIICGVYFFLTKQTTPPHTQVMTPPVMGTTGVIKQPEVKATTTPTNESMSNTDKITIPTNSGNVIVKNFYNNPQTYVFDKEKDALIKDHPDYQIQYLTQGNGFLISIINGKEPKNTRADAEKELLNILQITKSDACKLTMTVAVSKDISQNLAGPNYGLSWCPNGLPMGSNVSW